MRTVENTESVLAGRVLDGVGLAVFSDVRVFSESVTVNVGFLPEKVAVFCGKGSSGSAVTGVEALLLKDLCFLRVNLGAACSNETGKNNLKRNTKKFNVKETVALNVKNSVSCFQSFSLNPYSSKNFISLANKLFRSASNTF